MVHKKIPKPKRSKDTQLIDSTKATAPLHNKEPDISFSLKYLQSDKDFHINYTDVDYFKKVIDRLQNCCKMTKLSLIKDGSKTLRTHPIDWKDPKVTRSNFGLPEAGDLYDEAYQVSISQEEYGRLHGFFTEYSVFNIVWFDRDHKLYRTTSK